MLKPKITLLNGVAIAISMVVGSGLFGLPGLAIQTTDTLTALLGWGAVVLLMPAFFLVGGSYMAALLEVDTEKWTVPCALILAVMTTLINIRGVEKLGAINKVVVVLVLGVVVYICIRSLSSIAQATDSIYWSQVIATPLPQLWLAY